ncbi:MAG: glycosyltransferase [Lachnospiraceae bacterium]|nr:glycosyltransferase [Lachnospiraceae bacterium]
MKISILLTSYNGEKYITALLDSLRLQSRKADNIMIIDDRSSDSTKAIIEKYIDDYSLSDWSFSVNKKNLGWIKNFWFGIRALSQNSKGADDLIFICDQDDLWHPDKLAVMEKNMLKNPKADVLASGKKDFKAKEINDIPEMKKHYEYDPKKSREFLGYNNSFEFFYPGCTLCARADFLRSIDKYWGDFRYDDYILSSAALKRSLYFYDEKLIFQRLHSNNTTKRGSDAGNYEYQKKESRYNYKKSKALMEFSKELPKQGQAKKIKRLFKFSRIRNDLYEKSSIFSWLHLFFYTDCYYRRKAYFDDFKYVFRRYSSP